MRIDVITLFSSIFPGPLAESIPGRALDEGLAELHAHDLRQWGIGKHRSVDDYPYGGGAGMILRPEPVDEALDSVAPRDAGAFRILLDPGGEPFRQARAQDLSERERLVFVCPRYEGIDDRVRSMIDLELSVGDFVVSGGEIPALLVIDAVLRLLPGAIEDASTEDESFSAGLLEYPQWTRPPEFRGLSVPEILTSGNHGAVDAWRHEQAFERTQRNRPDLLTDDERDGD
jgi:tRNA (guanine37-N1)-methyltransferase